MTKERRDKAKAVSLRISKGLLSLLHVLNADFKFAVDQLRSNESDQFWSRTLIRCGCTNVEGCFAFMKQVTQECAAVFEVNLTADEIEIITELRVSSQPGCTVTRRKFLPFRDNIKQTFRIFLKAHTIADSIDYSGNGFKDLCATFELRNRLMHPKGVFDLQVDAQALETANRGFAWYDNLISEIFPKLGPQLLRV